MKQFDYIIRNPLGMELRHTGRLAKLAKRYADTTITITKGNQTAKVSQLTRLMYLSVKCGDKIIVTVDGPAEQTVFFNTRVFFERNL